MKASWITLFIDGLQSVVNASESVKGAISSSVAEGIERGFDRTAPSMVKLTIALGLLLIGLLLLGLGLGMALENFFNLAGLGYFLASLAFIVTGAAFYAINR